MADFRITELAALASADLAATDPLAVVDVSASETKKITAKAFTEKAVTLIDDASIPVAKVNFSGGINGSSITAGSIPAAKLDTNTIPATGGLTVLSGNLRLVAPNSPISLDPATGGLNHAVSGVTPGEYTKVTVDGKGHVSFGASLSAADIPRATASLVGGISVGSGLSATNAGVLNHSNSVAAGTSCGITYDSQGHVTAAAALSSADLPIASAGVPGAVSPGSGTSVNSAGALSMATATTSTLGGVIVGGDFAVSTGTISLATQAGLTAGAYSKVTVTTKGIITAGTSLVASDIPNFDASKITTGTFSTNLYGTNSITGAKLANYSTVQFGGAGSTSGVVTFPIAQFTGQGFFDSINGDYYLYDGNAWQPLTVISGDLVYAGTYNASTNTVATRTTAGIAAGLTVGAALPAASASLNRYYVVVAVNGTGTSPAPTVALAAPDMVICNGTTWDRVGTSTTVAGVSTASGITFTPYSGIQATDVQSALQELDDEKLGKIGGTITGELLIGTAGTFAFEGSTADAYETFLSAVDPTADRSIVFPNQSGNVIVSGNASIVNADINASAAIAGSKIVAATTSTVGAVQLSDSTSTTSSVLAATPTAVKAAYDLAAAALPTATASSTYAPLAGAAFTGDITLNTARSIRFADSDSSNYVAFKAPATVPSNITWTLPASDGTAGQVFSTNGSGTLSWITPATSGSSVPVSNLVNGTARQLLQTNSAGTAVEWTSNVSIPGTFAVQSNDAYINGVRVGKGNSSAGNNTALGYATLSSSTGTGNTAVGSSALTNSTTGSENTAIGTQALSTNISGSYNTGAGNGALYSNTSGGYNTALGWSSLISCQTGTSNVGIGAYAGFGLNTGSANIIIGIMIASGSRSPVFDDGSADNRIVMGHTQVTNAYIQVGWTVVSDARDKLNLGPVPHGLSFVNNLKPTKYQFKLDRNHNEANGKARYGFLAQDILELEGEEPVIIDNDNPDKLRYTSDSMIPVLVNAINELTAMVKALQAKVG